MNFFNRLITWAFSRNKPLLLWPRAHFNAVMSELDHRGGRCHEAGVFLLGRQLERGRLVTDAVYYDDLDPTAYNTGICILRAPSFSKLWALCRERGLIVVADAHTHRRGAGQSGSDKANPMVAQPGHIAVIVPNFAVAPINLKALGLYEYRGNHAWTVHSGRSWRRCLSFREPRNERRPKADAGYYASRCEDVHGQR